MGVKSCSLWCLDFVLLKDKQNLLSIWSSMRNIFLYFPLVSYSFVFCICIFNLYQTYFCGKQEAYFSKINSQLSALNYSQYYPNYLKYCDCYMQNFHILMFVSSLEFPWKHSLKQRPYENDLVEDASQSPQNVGK